MGKLLTTSDDQVSVGQVPAGEGRNLKSPIDSLDTYKLRRASVTSMTSSGKHEHMRDERENAVCRIYAFGMHEKKARSVGTPGPMNE